MWFAGILFAVTIAQEAADIRANASEVILDVVVRDKRGRPVKDLTPADLQILENGKTYAPATMRLVNPEASAAPADAKTPTVNKPSSDATRQLRLVTFLFEPLPRESARLAKETAVELVAKASGPNVYFNVMLARERLKMLQPFTTDAKLLSRGFQAATSTAGYRDADDMAKIAEENLRRLSNNEQELKGMLQGQVPDVNITPSNPDASDAVRAQAARVMINMLAMADTMQRQYAGRTSLNALRAAVKALAAIPGRKTIVYICRGLTSHPSLSQTFTDLTEAANAAGVSIYGVDATGLEVSERTREAAQMLARAAQASKDALQSDGAMTREQIMAFETAEQSAMANPSTLLAELAGGTGGLVLTDSNDSRKMAQQIADDISSYWEVTYRPEIERWDGSFHPVTVKVLRKGVKVQARKGYFALPPGTKGQVAPYEIPLLSAIQSKDPIEALQFAAVTADLLREPNGATRGDLTIELPLQDFEAEQDAAEAQFRFRASVLALFRNPQGEVVERQSQPVNYQGPLAKLPLAQQGLFHWRYAYTLAPGAYTVEIALQDRVGQKVGVRKLPVTVREIPAQALALSAISWVRPDPLPGEPSKDFIPLQTANAVLTPRAARSAPLAGAPEGGLPLHFILQHDGPATLEAEIVRDGVAVAKMPVDAASALPGVGRSTPYVITLPARVLEPGSYEIRIVATQGESRAAQTFAIALTAAPGYVKPVAVASAAQEETKAPLQLSPLPALSGSLSEAEKSALTAALRQHATDWVKSLIDFVCLQITDRSVDRGGKGQFVPADTLREMLTYSGGKETYERLAGSTVNYKKEEVPRGVRSFGEFGGLMRAVLSEDAAPQIEWKGYTDLDGQRMHVFEFHVSQEKSMYKLTQEAPYRVYKPSYSGQILAEPETMHIFQIKLQTSEIPEKFPFQEATHEIHYAFQRLGGVSYLLPSRSIMRTRVGKRTIVRSDMQFSNYRKWSSETKLRFDLDPN